MSVHIYDFIDCTLQLYDTNYNSSVASSMSGRDVMHREP